MRKKTVRKWYAVLVFLAVLMSTAIVGIFGIKTLWDKTNKDVVTVMNSTTEAKANEMNLILLRIKDAADTVSAYVGARVATSNQELDNHVIGRRLEEEMHELFQSTAENIEGAVGYYIRFNEPYNLLVRGFACRKSSNYSSFSQVDENLVFSESDSEGFENDWFAQVKARSNPVWMPIRECSYLDAHIFSYAVPVFFNKTLVGVACVDVNFEVLAQPVRKVSIYETGYAYLTDNKGKVYYHPRIGYGVMLTEDEDDVPEVDSALADTSTHGKLISYEYQGQKKEMTFQSLINGMRLVVTANEEDIEKEAVGLIWRIILSAIAILIVVFLLSLLVEKKKLHPVLDNMDDLAHLDGLTGLQNRTAFLEIQPVLNQKIREGTAAFGFVMLDINNLKQINDMYGHKRGDKYLLSLVEMIHDNFPGYQTYRIGGDEFVVLAEGTAAMKDIAECMKKSDAWLDRRQKEKSDPWDIPSAAMAYVSFDPAVHKNAEDVLADADKQMYQNKQVMKGKNITVAAGQTGRKSTSEKSISDADSSDKSVISYDERYDQLTGLPDMTLFFELAEAGKEEVLKRNGHPGLVYLNFSGMKFYNLKHSFEEGDKLLQTFAGLLAEIFGKEHCSRFAADHFVIYTEQDGLEDKLNSLFERWKETEYGSSLPLHAGIYLSGSEKIHISIACDRAKFACSSLSGIYENTFCYFSRVQRDDVEKQRYIIETFDRAISEKWIHVHYQPIVRTVNGKVCDEECLSRWNDPEKGMLSPAEFIPALENAGLIYKLDLYVVEEILEKIRKSKELGLPIVPQSINLSRSDFGLCDIVEEIRSRVDDAGIQRNIIAIEITESVIGSDFDFMKQQIDRFRNLGFQVWMDDFGSGYSSLDVLQSIRFDLIKFDMSFMQKLEEENGRVILTELMRMATSLNVDAICEGVETEEQVRFLKEIGCSKQQGYYYSEPLAFDKVLEKIKTRSRIVYENPDESDYYGTMSRVNLYDFSIISNIDDSGLKNFFNTLPMGIIEINGDKARFIMSNQSYRDFINRYYDFNLSIDGTGFTRFDSPFIRNIIKVSKEPGSRSLFNEKMPDGSIVHSIARTLAVNPVNGNIAVAAAVLSVTDASEGTTYADIARVLAADYYNIFYVNLETGQYIEYSSPAGEEELAVERHGNDFFRDVGKNSAEQIYAEDRDTLLSVFTKESIINELDKQGVFTATYRLMVNDAPMYAYLKATRLQPGSSYIIMGVSIIDSQMKRMEEEKRSQQEKAVLRRIAALSGDYLAIYVVDIKTGHYLEYTSVEDYEGYNLPKDGEDFFTRVHYDALQTIAPEDLSRFLNYYTSEVMTQKVKEEGVFVFHYGLLMDGIKIPVSTRATLVEEEDGDKLIVGIIKDR